jgi:stage II sporulation protein GA (sporulation sigma-E factor processing peptidase)
MMEPSSKGGGRLEVYLDLVMLLNFLVDFLLLLGTNRLSGFPAGAGRCTLGALVGSVYSGACLLPGFSFLGNIPWRVTALALMGTAAFGLGAGAVKRTAVFLLLSMALGGLVISLGHNDFTALTLAALLCWGLCRVCFGNTIGSREYVPLTLTYGGQCASLIALRDSGNTLRDPVTGQQVLVVSGSVGQRLTGLTEHQLRHPLETMAQRPVQGLRLIPYKSVGQNNGFLLGLRMEQVKIGNLVSDAVVAFAAEDFGRGEVYQALTGGAL